MDVKLTSKLSRNGLKRYWFLEWGKAAGKRIATGSYTWEKPRNQVEKNHNKEVSRLLELKRSQAVLDLQASGTSYIPAHRLNTNFFDYFSDFVTKNQREGNRSLSATLTALQKFTGKHSMAPQEITENFCERFRQYLLDNLSGETPADYFMRFKRVLKAATKEGYFRSNPSADLKVKSNPIKEKEILEVAEWQRLLKASCTNHEVKKAAIFSLYTGLRWCDVSTLRWEQISDGYLKKTQAKTGHTLEVPIHKIALAVLGTPAPFGPVFHLPTQDGANNLLKAWVKSAGINKHITWHCLRHSTSVILQDAGATTQTVAGILGHTSTKYVHKTYKRYRKDKGEEAISRLPGDDGE